MVRISLTSRMTAGMRNSAPLALCTVARESLMTSTLPFVIRHTARFQCTRLRKV
jgi:hypothetical protein